MNRRQRKKVEKKHILTIAPNVFKPVLPVRYADLRRFNDQSPYKSCCPVCGDGILLMTRHPETGALLTRDTCVLCGQHFHYTDLDQTGLR